MGNAAARRRRGFRSSFKHSLSPPTANFASGGPEEVSLESVAGNAYIQFIFPLRQGLYPQRAVAARIVARGHAHLFWSGNRRADRQGQRLCRRFRRAGAGALQGLALVGLAQTAQREPLLRKTLQRCLDLFDMQSRALFF